MWMVSWKVYILEQCGKNFSMRADNNDEGKRITKTSMVAIDEKALKEFCYLKSGKDNP